MELTQTQMQSYIRGSRQRDEERHSLLRLRRERARVVALQAAEILKTDFGAAEVILYGSVAHGAWFREDSDVDLAATGIPADFFWKAWAAIDALDSDIEVNLIDLGDAQPALLQEIRISGEIL